ncbi:MAG: hypothetical protein ACI8RC_003408, partial [Ilumatobacter sp.]
MSSQSVAVIVQPFLNSSGGGAVSAIRSVVEVVS